MSVWTSSLVTLLLGAMIPMAAHATSTRLTGSTTFGSITIGQTKTNIFTLKNTSKTSVRLDSNWFSGDSSYSVAGGTCSYDTTTGWILKAGASCTVQVKFAPTVAGGINSKLVVGYFLNTGWTWEEISISMSGTGVQATTTTPTPTPSPSPTPTTGAWLQTSGNKIVNSAGQQVLLKGVNIADPEALDVKTWERPGVSARSVASLAADQYNAKVIRLPILPGDPAYPTEGFFGTVNGGDTYYQNHILPLVTELTSKGIYVIIDLHYVSDYSSLYSKVESFWKYMAPKFANNPYVMYEIFNEPIYPDDWSTWKNTMAQPIVNVIRSLAPNNLILVGGPYWSSHISGAATDPVVGSNIVYVGHVYSNQSPSIWDTRYATVANKYPLFITEWGFETGGTEGGDITYGKAWTDWMAAHNLSWTAWCFDNLWGPRMFNSDWTLKTSPGGMGELVRDLLAK